MKTTLIKIRSNSPCKEGWETLLKHLGKFQADDVELPLLTIFESNGFDDALWCLRAVDGFEKEKRLLAVAFAREVQHLMVDPRSVAALDVSERFANGDATQEELELARDAARDAAYAAWDVADAPPSMPLELAADAAVWAADDAHADAAAWSADDAHAAALLAAADDIRQKQVEIFKKFMV